MVERLALQAGGHRFTGGWVFRALDVEVEGGTVLQVTGANGSGKTTLLRILSTLLPPREGRLEWGGAPLGGSRLAAFRRRVGVHLTWPLLYEGLTVAENLAFFETVCAGGRTAERRDILDALGLSRALGERAGVLSDGFKQRVSLAKIFLADPDFLFLDEPFSHLDASAARALEDLVGERVRAGRAVVMAGPGLASSLTVESRALDLSRLAPEREGVLV